LAQKEEAPWGPQNAVNRIGANTREELTGWSRQEGEKQKIGQPSQSINSKEGLTNSQRSEDGKEAREARLRVGKKGVGVRGGSGTRIKKAE